MKVSPTGISYNSRVYSCKSSVKKSLGSSKPSGLKTAQNDSVVFKAKAGKIAGKLTGALTGAAAGGAIIGGGSLATGLAMLSGPIGWAALGAAYFAGGALMGGYLGGAFGDIIEDSINKSDDKNKKE